MALFLNVSAQVGEGDETVALGFAFLDQLLQDLCVGGRGGVEQDNALNYPEPMGQMKESAEYLRKIFNGNSPLGGAP